MEKDCRNTFVPNASILPEWRTNRFTVINVASVGELLVGASNCWSELLVNHLLQTTNFFRHFVLLDSWCLSRQTRAMSVDYGTNIAVFK